MAASAGKNPIALYRYFLRQLSPLPTEARKHYKHRIKQEFMSYSDEYDPERIRQLTEQGSRDIDWLLKKYEVPAPPNINS